MTLLALLLACAAPDDTADRARDTARPGQDTAEPPVDVDQREANLTSGPGDFATDYLTAEPYDRLVIEVDWVAGNAPDADALDDLADRIRALCHKPGGVDVVLDDEIPPQGAPTWSQRDAEALEIAWRDRYHDPETGTAALYYLYLDGDYEGDSDGARVLGFAHHGASLVMFREAMDAASGSLPLLGGSVEPSVLAHELGHVLGLVNNGVPMVTPHADPEHPRHDANEDCLMYWAVETSAIVDVLGGGAPAFDAACRADLTAAGGRP